MSEQSNIESRPIPSDTSGTLPNNIYVVRTTGSLLSTPQGVPHGIKRPETTVLDDQVSKRPRITISTANIPSNQISLLRPSFDTSLSAATATMPNTQQLDKRITDLESTIGTSIDKGIDKGFEALFQKMTNEGFLGRITTLEGAINGPASGLKALGARVSSLENTPVNPGECSATVKQLKAVVSRQANQIAVLEKNVLLNSSTALANQLIIGGLLVQPNENHKGAAIQFFQEVMGLHPQDRDVFFAFRMGKPTTRVVKGNAITFPPALVVKVSEYFRNHVM